MLEANGVTISVATASYQTSPLVFGSPVGTHRHTHARTHTHIHTHTRAHIDMHPTLTQVMATHATDTRIRAYNSR